VGFEEEERVVVAPLANGFGFDVEFMYPLTVILAFPFVFAVIVLPFSSASLPLSQTPQPKAE
jgi:hypothetical protein